MYCAVCTADGSAQGELRGLFYSTPQPGLSCSRLVADNPAGVAAARASADIVSPLSPGELNEGGDHTVLGARLCLLPPAPREPGRLGKAGGSDVGGEVRRTFNHSLVHL